ncbi:MAG TPA: flagellar motor switch protein FliM [Steroidobacteraceae bacterium]|nr:flagellar motor switch protein FliM [Steroidobacteraceae bacterium]
MSADRILDPAEVDALISRVGGAEVSMHPAFTAAEIVPWDFSVPRRTVDTRSPALDLINERFVRATRASLYNLLRRSADISVLPVQTLTLAEYLASLKSPSSLNLVKVTPLRGVGLVMLEPLLVFTIVDHFFGGNGRNSFVDGREFTAAEQRIIHMMLRNVFADLREAWAPVTAIELEFLQSEIDPQLAAIDAPTELVIVSGCHIELAGGGGNLHVTLPWSMVEPLRPLLDAGLAAARPEKDPRWSQSLRDEIEAAEVELRTVLGSTALTLAALLNLKPDDILPCDFTGKVTLCADEVPLFRGSFGLSHGLQAVKIEERLGPASTLPPDTANAKV